MLYMRSCLQSQAFERTGFSFGFLARINRSVDFRHICTSSQRCYQKDYYSILGVPRTASPKDIKNKFIEQCKRYHPDKQTGGTEKERDAIKKRFQEINEAYSVLSKTPEQRSQDQEEDWRRN